MDHADGCHPQFGPYAKPPLSVKPAWLAEEERARTLIGFIAATGSGSYWPLSEWAVELATLLASIERRAAKPKPPTFSESKVLAALKSCIQVMENDLGGLRVIQPELREAKDAVRLYEHGKL